MFFTLFGYKVRGGWGGSQGKAIEGNRIFDIVTTHNNEICYVKHVLAPLCVFFKHGRLNSTRPTSPPLDLCT